MLDKKESEIELGNKRDDNSTQYLEVLESTLKYSDPYSKLSVRLTGMGDYVFTVTPSQYSFKEALIENIVSFHRNIGMKAVFSKSLEKSKRISFQLS